MSTNSNANDSSSNRSHSNKSSNNTNNCSRRPIDDERSMANIGSALDVNEKSQCTNTNNSSLTPTEQQNRRQQQPTTSRICQRSTNDAIGEADEIGVVATSNSLRKRRKVAYTNNYSEQAMNDEIADTMSGISTATGELANGTASSASSLSTSRSTNGMPPADSMLPSGSAPASGSASRSVSGSTSTTGSTSTFGSTSLPPEYKPDHLVDKRIMDSRVEYLVCWQGFPDRSDHSWEPIEHLNLCVYDILEYERNKVGVVEQPQPDLDDIEDYGRIVKHRANTESTEKVVRLLAFDVARRVLYLNWTNGLVTMWRLEDLTDQESLISLSSLTNFNLSACEAGLQVNVSKVQRLSNLLVANFANSKFWRCEQNNTWLNWFVYRKGFLRVKKNRPTEEVESVPYIEYVQCHTCGQHFEAPVLGLFAHMLTTGHNGSYCKVLDDGRDDETEE